MKRLLLAATFLASVVGPSIAAPSTDAFEDILAELESRRDEDFTGTLDKTQKKQQKAVLKSLAAFAKEHTSFSQDLKTAGKVAKILAKAYPTEFDEESPEQALHVALFLGVNPYSALVSDAYGEVEFAALKAAKASTKKKVEVLLDKASDALSGFNPAGTAVERAKAGEKAAKFVETAAKLVGKDPGADNFMVADIAGQAWGGAEPFAEYNETTHELQLFGVFTNPVSNYQQYVVVVVDGVTGPGTYPIVAGEAWYDVGIGVSFTRYASVESTGTLVVTTLDTEGGVFEGTFEFDGHNEGNGLTIAVGSGEFRLTEIFLQ
jgi:hypothetical protein